MSLQLSRDFILSQLKVAIAYWCGRDCRVGCWYFAFRGDHASNLIIHSFDIYILFLFFIFLSEVCAKVADFKVALLSWSRWVGHFCIAVVLFVTWIHLFLFIFVFSLFVWHGERSGQGDIPCGRSYFRVQETYIWEYFHGLAAIVYVVMKVTHVVECLYLRLGRLRGL